MPKQSIKGVARAAVRDDAKLRTSSVDSFVNFAQKLGIGADNPLSSAQYAFNPITRQRTMLEWIHRGSWLGGVAVDVVADDMTRAGIEYVSEMEPQDSESIDSSIQDMGIWKQINETVKWSRLYGGCVAVMLIDGQDLKTPLKMETVGKDGFKGLLVLDRWMLEPTLEDLVTNYGPDLGLPRMYRVQANAPALRGMAIHYTRIAFRLVGVQLPYQQRLTENLWGLSILERLYDRMISYDSASTGAAQLIYKAYLRTLSVEGMREIVSSGGPAMEGLVKYTDMMRRFQGIEGITLIDAKDKFEAQTHGAFSGLSDALTQFAQQLSGALQIPLTRLFGQASPGFSDGDNDVRNYYDHIKQRQEADLKTGIIKIYKLTAQSLGIKVPDNFGINFKSLWQLTETDKATIAKTNADTILQVHEAALISDQTALQELRQSSRVTGVFTNITAELIDAADDEIPDPMEGMIDPETGLPMPNQLPALPNGEKPQGAEGKSDGKEPQSEVAPSPAS